MKKIVQNMMYIVSLLMVVGVLVLLVTRGKSSQSAESHEAEIIVEEAQKEIVETEKSESETTEEPETESKITEPSENPVKNVQEKVTENEEITIIFAGDVLFANAFKAGYDADGIEGVIDEELLKELQEADILMVNNEFPFSEQETPVEDKQYTFACSPSYVKALEEMGVDVVSLANNHVLDYGKEALRDTFATLDDAGILYGGAGESTERAEEVQIIEVNGKKCGFLAVSRVVPTGDWKVENSAPGVFSCYDDRRLVELVEQASTECDFLAVYPHWGVEYAAYPESYQTKIAEHCLVAGADMVVGSHTHCLQGAEFIEDKPVFYSLGNFVFGQNIDKSAVLKVTISSEGEIAYQYLPVYATDGVTYLATGEKAKEICSYLDEISPEAQVNEDGRVKR